MIVYGTKVTVHIVYGENDERVFHGTLMGDYEGDGAVSILRMKRAHVFPANRILYVEVDHA